MKKVSIWRIHDQANELFHARLLIESCGVRFTERQLDLICARTELFMQAKVALQWLGALR